jgi:hydrogenase/urease accessory protein HupE
MSFSDPLDPTYTQYTIVIGFIILMGMAVWIDGEFGDRVLAVLIGTFGLILGYFFHDAKSSKAQINSPPPQPPCPEQKV